MSKKQTLPTFNDYTLPGTTAGDAFNSELVLVDVAASVKEAEAEDKIAHHLAAKFLSLDIMNREFNRNVKSHMKEYLIYTEVIRGLNEFQAARAPEEPTMSIPDLIYGKCTEKEFVLLMENLKVLGYETNDKRKGMDLHHLEAAIDQLARLHALSYAYNQSNNFQKKYKYFKSISEHLRAFKVMVTVVLENCSVLLKSLSNKEDLRRRLEMSKHSLMDKYLAALLEGENTISCLIHGDFWNNNLMFRYKDPTSGQTQNEVEEIKVIDWGSSSWGNPMLDLQYLLHTSTTRPVREAHLHQLLEQYHSTFTRLAAKVGSPPTNWSFQQFMSEWRKTYIIGFALGCTLTQGTLSTSNPVSREPQPSVLDKAFCLPVRVAVDGLKCGLAKLLAPLMFKPSCEFLLTGAFRQMFKPILAELASGKNEVMNTRLLDLITEADQNGLFTTESG